MISDSEIKAALQKVKSVYGLAHAKRLEQLYRNETAHFKSGNFKVTLSPGMEVGNSKMTFAYGWNSLEIFWNTHPQYKPSGTFKQVENTSALATAKKKPKTFITFPNIEASMMTVSELIHIRNGNFGSWFAKDPVKQKQYNNILDTIKSRFVS